MDFNEYTLADFDYFGSLHDICAKTRPKNDGKPPAAKYQTHNDDLQYWTNLVQFLYHIEGNLIEF